MRDFTQIRPRFKFTVQIEKEKLIERFKGLFENKDGKFSGKVMQNHIVLDIIGPEAHYWSPHFSFRIEEDEENESQSIIYGHIGPKPTVWTLFRFIYIAIGVTGFFLTSYAGAQMSLGQAFPMIWAFPVSVLVMSTAYGTSKYGQSLGKEQIEEMKAYLNKAL